MPAYLRPRSPTGRVAARPRRAHIGGAVELRVVQITSATVLPEPELFARVRAVASVPGFAVQLRDPELPARALLALGARLRAAGARLLVNDRLDLALALRAEGVHLGRRSVSVADARALLGPHAWICVACHDRDDALRAAGEGADAVTLSPIFASPGKGRPLGLAALAALAAALPPRVRILALGGVDERNAAACIAAGAHGVALIRADPRAVLDAFARSC
jgi:thiamine-phosphate pyrophosphorylase